MPDQIVLCYHALSPTWEADLSTTPQLFEAQIQTLLRRGYRPQRFTELIEQPRVPRAFAVTFDDGYSSVLELGLPILARLGVPATLFVPTDHIATGRPMSWPGIEEWLGTPSEHELMPMDWDGVRALRDAGWEIGSHTCSHPHLTQLSDAELSDELSRSREVCEGHLAGPCLSIAYPYGDHDPRVVAAARRAGYATAGTLPERFTPGGPLDWPRIGIYRADDERRFALKVSPVVRAVRASRAWDALGAVRGRLGR
jgi:peptidoglycan/xylan/chitin deacetylase (PgdA/CDA1 family)